MSYFNNEKGFSDNKQFETQGATTPPFEPTPTPSPPSSPLTPSGVRNRGKITEGVSNKQSRSESRLGNPLLSSNFNVGSSMAEPGTRGEGDRNSPFFPSPLGVRLPVPQRERGPEEKKVKEVVSITYEEIGLFPRSFSRVLDRFLKQVFSDVENLVIQEYRFYRYLFLTTLKCLLILFFVPFFVNFLAKTYVVRPLTEYFWNTKQSEIFLNSYQQKRAFSELKEFEEKTYFESLIFPKSAFTPNMVTLAHKHALVPYLPPPMEKEEEVSQSPYLFGIKEQKEQKEQKEGEQKQTGMVPTGLTCTGGPRSLEPAIEEACTSQAQTIAPQKKAIESTEVQSKLAMEMENDASVSDAFQPVSSRGPLLTPASQGKEGEHPALEEPENGISREFAPRAFASRSQVPTMVGSSQEENRVKTDLLINSYTMKSSLFVYQTQEASKNMQQRYQEKTIELAQRYNDQSIEAITNFFADLISLFTLLYLLYALEIQINITKSFLLEVFFGLDDSKKSLLILLITDLLVGYHSSNLWELFFEFLFHHYGLPDSQTGIFLLVATLPVLLDVLFKYLIFRHLNRSSPATVATYRAMIE